MYRYSVLRTFCCSVPTSEYLLSTVFFCKVILQHVDYCICANFLQNDQSLYLSFLVGVYFTASDERHSKKLFLQINRITTITTITPSLL
jgi:hypothetical protein